MKKQDVIYTNYKNIINNVLSEIIESKDTMRWLALFDVTEDLANEAQLEWIEGFVLNELYDGITIFIDNIDIVSKFCYVNLYFVIKMRGYDTIEELFRYTTVWDNPGKFKIVWYERIRSKIPKSGNNVSLHLCCLSDLSVQDIKDKKNKECNLKKEILVRSISRSIRFRETFPIFEVVLQIIDIMSAHTLALAKGIYSVDKYQVLLNLYNLSVDNIFIEIPRKDRDNSMVSKYTVPSYTVDELIYLNKRKCISGNCSQIISLFYAMLRFYFEPKDLYQVRFGNHDYLFIFCNDKLYCLSDILINVTDKTYFPVKGISKIYNEEFILTNRYSYGISLERYKKLVAAFNEYAPQLELPQIAENTNENIITIAPIMLPDLREDIDEVVYVNNIRKFVWERASTIPLYTICKYSLQSINVEYPEVYIYWGTQSKIVKIFMDKYETLKELNDEVCQYDQKSIFIDNDRVMMPDQVIKYRSADKNSLVLLYAVWFINYRYPIKSILLGESSNYCEFLKEGDYYDIVKKKWIPKENIKENILYKISMGGLNNEQK